MASITIRGLDEKVKKALRMQAAANSRSMEAEARIVLEEIFTKAKTATQKKNMLLEMHAKFRAIGGIRLSLPERTPVRKPPSFD